jgi:hypothetical protein
VLRVGIAALLAVSVGWTDTTASAQEASYSPKVGSQHSGFVLPAIDDGHAVALSQFRGKKVLLIHFASW